ncbi:MAG: tetratricopeptide repeat protein [Pseudomonadota bacterium]|nr:tetratricopeptide repeat protein [Pseudomonadota bacterium]
MFYIQGMSTPDVRGNPCGSSHRSALEAAESALWRMMSFYDSPVADLQAAAAADPAWALPHVMQAGVVLGLNEAGLLPQARSHIVTAEALAEAAPPRERAHLKAAKLLLEGRSQAACCVWDELLLAHPRDALALHFAQLWDFHRGDVKGLRQRPARALPEWDEADPLYPHVLALYAFGLEEDHLYPQAEEAGRRALALQPRAPWAVHAVAHVMDMQGRYEEGAGWLRLHQSAWAEGNQFAAHLWWHKSLFRLEAMDLVGVLRLVDTHLSGDALQFTAQRVDAISMLWRLHLLGEDVSAVFKQVLAQWPLDDAEAGHHAFNDVHAVLAWLGADEPQRAEAWVARCAARALEPADARRSDHLVMREIGLPLMRGLLALARGDADGAVDTIYPMRNQAQRLGGSHAQRDLVDHTLLAAAAQGGRRALGHALLNERQMSKPVTPLMREWMDRMAVPDTLRA